MAKKNEKHGKKGEVPKLVSVALAADLDEARAFCELLADHEIAAVLAAEADDYDRTPAGEIPVYVRMELRDEAAAIIAEREGFESPGDEYEQEVEGEDGEAELIEVEESELFGELEEEEDEEEEVEEDEEEQLPPGEA